MTTQEIDKSCEIIVAELSKHVHEDNIAAVQVKLVTLSALIGLSAQIMRYARQNFLYKQKSIIEQNKSENLSPSILKIKIESEAWEELGLITYTDRLNAGITHCMESLRTIISKYKAELEYSKYQA